MLAASQVKMSDSEKNNSEQEHRQLVKFFGEHIRQFFHKSNV